MEKTAEVQCITCKRILPLSEFRGHRTKSGVRYRRYCRDCERKKSRDRYYQQKAPSMINPKASEVLCFTCKRVLPLAKFRRYKNTSGFIGYRRSCRECEKTESVKMQCVTCKQFLPLSAFRRYENISGRIGYRSYCKECEREQNWKRRQQKKAQVNQEDNFRFMDFYRKVKFGNGF